MTPHSLFPNNAAQASAVHHQHTHPHAHTHTGPLKSLQARTYDCARVQFAGEVPDTFFGAYQDDLKHGQGVYCFATGALYVGDFKVGARWG